MFLLEKIRDGGFTGGDTPGKADYKHCPEALDRQAIGDLQFLVTMASLPSLSTSPLPAPVGASDPLSSFLSTTCMDLLLIELVPLARRLAAQPLPIADTVFLDTTPPTNTELDDDSERESMYFRLEPLGFRVGQGVAER
jgi:hypothetical protein